MQIAVIGGGIGGLALANGLHNQGIKVHVYEKASSFKPLGAGIGLGSNAVLALEEIGIKQITREGMPLYKQVFLDKNFDVMNTIDFSLLKRRFGEETITIQRSDLHNALREQLDPDYLHFNHEVTDFESHPDHITLTFSNGLSKTVDYVIAADGIHSVFRQKLFPKHKIRYANYTCWRGITKNKGDVELNTSHEAWSDKGRFGWAPLKNNEVYWFGCVNAPEADQYLQSKNKDEVALLFEHFSPVIKRLVQETDPDYFLHHDIYDIEPLDRFYKNRVILLGDAAHATTPNMGQGAGQSIEDAHALTYAIKHNQTMNQALVDYNKARVKKARKVIELSRQIGQAAQWDKPLLTYFRDTVFPFVPKSLLFWRLTFLFK